MDAIISYCGLVCTECPAFVATRNDDDALRARTAAEWSKQFNVEIKKEDIYCKGCLNEEGRIFGHCSVCGIRACGRERKVGNCAGCGEYSCTKLDEFLAMVPAARDKLESIRAAGGAR
ncbi:MAG: DUF3795 domain-containing protein [Spirochaetes bacterium]|nr:MAG: DUF3795 domain-containing protein [Spirochaetota bacterium]